MKTKPQSNNVKDITNVLINVGEGMHTKNFINANAATLALTSNDSGREILLNRAAGCIVTLPVSEPGLTYKFRVITTVTSNAYGIYGKATTDLFVGGVASDDTDTSNAARFFNPDVSDDDRMDMNGSTTGGLIGSYFEVVCTAAGRWFITGVNKGSGSVATPFS